MKQSVCAICQRPKEFKGGRGWVHLDGGGRYMMRCLDCGHKASLCPSLVVCPECGSENWVHDHCVL